MYYLSYITYYVLPIDCLLIALDAHIFSHTEYGPGTKHQGPKAAGPQHSHQGQSIGNR